MPERLFRAFSWPAMEESLRPAPPGTDRGILSPILLAVLLGACSLALLPNAFEADRVKAPLLVAGSVLLFGIGVASAVRRRCVPLVRTPVDILILMLLLYAIVRSFRSPDPHAARDASLLWGAFGFFFFAGTHIFRDARAVHALFRSFAVVAAAVLLIGGAQFFFPNLPGIDFFVIPDKRIPSTLGNPSLLAAYVAGLLPLILAEARSSGRLTSVVLLLLGAGLTFLLFATGSRGGFLAAISSLSILTALSVKSTRKAFWIVAGIAVSAFLLIIFIPALRERFFAMLSGGTDTSLERRVVFWEAAWRAFLASPWFGNGTGSFEQIIPLFRSPDYWLAGSEDIVRHAHNEPMELGVEFGITGLCLWSVIIVLTVREGIRGTGTTDDNHRIMVAALAAGLVGILVDNLTGVSLRHPSVAPYAWLFMGILWSPAIRGGRTELRIVTLRIYRGAAIILIAGAALWAAFHIRQHLPRFASESHLMDGLSAEKGHDSLVAGREFIRAYEAEPGNPQAAMKAAQTLFYFRGRPIDALAALDDVQRRAPNFPRAYLLRSQVLFSLGRTTEAEENITRELALCSLPESFYHQSVLARFKGDSTGERRALRRQLELSLKSGRRAFVEQALERWDALPTQGPDSADVAAIGAQTRQRFGIGRTPR